MNLLENIDKDLELSFKKVVSNGWKLRNAIVAISEKEIEIDSEQNRLHNYYESLKEIKEICWSHITPSGKFLKRDMDNELKAIENEALQNEKYERAYIAHIYQKLLSKI